MIYDKVKALADKRGLSIRELENQAGLSNGTIGKWRTKQPTAVNLYAVANVLSVTIDRLMADEEKG